MNETFVVRADVCFWVLVAITIIDAIGMVLLRLANSALMARLKKEGLE